MNNLETIISQLVEEIAAYIRENEDIRKLRDSELQSEVSSKPIANTKATETVASDSSTTATSDADDTPGIFSMLAYGAAKLVLTGHNETKASKASAAIKFVEDLKKLQLSLEGVYVPELVNVKLDELIKLLANEIEAINTIRLKFGKLPGKYDALLQVFQQLVNAFRSNKDINEVLCISLKTHEVKEVVTQGNLTYYPLIPKTKELVELLSNKLLEIQLDKARNAESEILGYTKIVPDTAYDRLMEFLPEAVRSLDNHNTIFSIAQKAGYPDANDRLRNLRDILAALCLYVDQTRACERSLMKLPYPLGSETFLEKLLTSLEQMHEEVVEKLRNLKVDSVTPGSTVAKPLVFSATTSTSKVVYIPPAQSTKPQPLDLTGPKPWRSGLGGG